LQICNRCFNGINYAKTIFVKPAVSSLRGSASFAVRSFQLRTTMPRDCVSNQYPNFLYKLH